MLYHRLTTVGLVAALIATVTVGCDSDSTSEIVSENNDTERVIPAQRVYFKYGTPDAMKWGRMSGTERKKGRKRSVKYMRKSAEAVQAIRSTLTSKTKTVEEKLRAAKRVVAEHSGQPYQYLLEQTIGRMLISQVFAGGTLNQFDLETARSRSVTESEREAAGYAATLLARHANPNADFIAAGLVHQEGHWSESKMKSVAQKGVNAASDWISTSCESCAAVETAKEEVETAQARRAVAVESGVEHLRRFTDSE